MMGYWRKIAACMIAVLCIGSLGACQKDIEKGERKASGTDTENLSEVSASKGRFMESDVEFSYGEIYEQQALEDGRLRILCSTGVYDSADQGKTWKAWENQPEEFLNDLKLEYAVSGLAMARDGGFFYCLYEKEEVSYKYVDKEGSLKDLSMGQYLVEQDTKEQPGQSNFSGMEKGRIHGMGFSLAGELLAADENGYIYQIDCIADTLVHKYKPEDDGGDIMTLPTVIPVGNQMILIYDRMTISGEGDFSYEKTDVLVYDLVTHEQKEASQVLEDFLSEGAGGEKEERTSNYLPSFDGNAIYIVNTSGIYRFMMGGTVVEKIFDGALGQMNSSYAIGGTVVDERNLYILYSGVSEYDLIRYTFDPEAPSVPEKEVTVYSLYDNQMMRQAITKFQKENPDVYVNFDIGITGTDAMTESDAIKNLNTNIMAGEGPDVLFLDGMPINSYMEKGLLADISDVIQEVSAADGLFENIAGTYQQDGKITAVPLNFSVPVMLGTKEALTGATDLNNFAQWIVRLKEERPDQNVFLDKLDVNTLIKSLLPSSSPAWIKEDGTLDESAIAEFLNNADQLAGSNREPLAPVYDTEDDPQPFELAQFMTTGHNYISLLVFYKAELSMFNMSNSIDFSYVNAYINQMEDFDYKPASGQAQNTYIPINPVGICANSKETETAKLFLKFLLEKEDEVTSVWPVNKKRFQACMEKPSDLKERLMEFHNEEDGSIATIDYKWPDREQTAAFEKMAEGLDTPSVMDNRINRTVLEVGEKCLRGEFSAEEAAKNIIDKLNLYLSE